MLPSVNDNVVFFKSAHDYAVRENSQEISYIKSYQKILYSSTILFIANDFPTDDGEHDRYYKKMIETWINVLDNLRIAIYSYETVQSEWI